MKKTISAIICLLVITGCDTDTESEIQFRPINEHPLKEYFKPEGVFVLKHFGLFKGICEDKMLRTECKNKAKDAEKEAKRVGVSATYIDFMNPEYHKLVYKIIEEDMKKKTNIILKYRKSDSFDKIKNEYSNLKYKIYSEFLNDPEIYTKNAK